MSHVKDIIEAHKIGFNEGFEKGSHEGFIEGFNKGFNKGFDEGTCKAWEKANETIASLQADNALKVDTPRPERIYAIKMIRDRFQLTLREARDVVIEVYALSGIKF